MAAIPNADFLEGGGEMGARMRAFDWSTTPLGAPAHWPRSLKTAVRIMLTSRQPFWLGWGPQLTYLYNDAYKSIIGGKHPHALGRPFSEVWSEIWDVVGPMAANVMDRDEGTYVEAQLLIMERHGYAEETYYTFSYSPVPDDEGGKGGLICANTDDTRRVIGERQVALLREIAATAANARTWLDACRLAAQAMATDPRDIPFALLFVEDAQGGRPQLAACTPGAEALSAAELWPLTGILRTSEHRVIALDAMTVEVPRGAWDKRPAHAAILPVAPSGNTGRAGVLVVGLNPYRKLEAEYRGFLDLVCGQVAAAIGNAQAYEEERHRAEALAELDRAKTVFFSNVSHELRTPLTLMLGPLEDLIGRPEPLDAPARETLAMVQRNGQRLLRLVNTLLDFARIEAGRSRGTFEPTDLGSFTADVASSFRSVCERAGLELKVRCDSGGEPAYVDRDMWEKIVLNLLSNAFKFTLEGEIDVSLTPTTGGFELRVRDSGIGIPPEALPRMFERFHRVEGHRGRTHEGTGIGLALVQELVRLHGGTVEVASRVGEGTTFTVRIPAGDAHLAKEAIREAGASTPARGRAAFVDEAIGWIGGTPQASPLAGDAASVQRKRVLLADDNADLRDYARRLLAPYYEVEAVADGVDALGAVRARRPDVIVTDVMMPRLDGFGLLRAVREDPALRTIPVVMLSARAGEEARIEGLDQGADDYLVKPFSSRELLVRVGAIVRAEEIRHEARRALAESESRFRALAEAAPAFIWFTDARGEPQYVNRQHVEAIGKDAADIGSGRWHALIHPDDRENYIAHFERAVVERAPLHVRGRMRRADGTWCWIDSHAQPLFDEAGVFLGHVGISADITENAEHEQALQEADRRKDEFLATLSHELRNPLAPLRNALFMLRMRDGGAAAAGAKVIEMMERQVNHLVRLVDDLLEMSRISRGTLELQRERVDLGTVVRNAVETSQPLIEDNRHKLEVTLPQDTLWLDGDAVRLAQVLSNLLNNAAKYTPAGGMIRVNAWREPGQVAVSVQDNGHGIDPELLPRIFDMFTRGQHAGGRGPGGLGIGLALALRIARMHGGTIEARNLVAAGSEFILRLPLAAEASNAGTLQPSIPASLLRGLQVLVVDDNRDAGDTLCAILEHLGAAARVARGGEDALALVARWRPDVALLDIGMPGMDGYELAAALRARLGNGLRLAALTGWGQDDDRRRATSAGFDHHLVKPVDVSELTRLLSMVEPARVSLD